LYAFFDTIDFFIDFPNSSKPQKQAEQEEKAREQAERIKKARTELEKILSEKGPLRKTSKTGKRRWLAVRNT
jgi:hypothetical protein